MVGMQGRFRMWMPRPTKLLRAGWIGEPDIIIPNQVTEAGQEAYLKAIFQNVFAIAGGDNFYIGLVNQTPAAADTLAEISSEPTSQGGYARQAVPRNSTGWPTVTTINGRRVIQSTVETFTATGDDFSASITRAFLTDAASGSTGTLFAYSGALISPLLITEDNSFQVQYETFLGG